MFTKGIGPVTAKCLWETFGSIEAIMGADSNALANVKGMSSPISKSLKEKESSGAAEEILLASEKAGAGILTLDDGLYPSLLKEIPDPPTVLFYRGDPTLLAGKNIAIVGSRKATSYGNSAAEKLAFDLASAGMFIVSGLAKGIDRAAHIGALSSKGKTIAVLGTGIDICYPAENKELMEKIAETSLIVSEFPPGTEPEGRNFPKRNRIISGLCMGTIIVEAAEKSGSLITGHLALEQNRELFAVPGRITSSNSFGTNYLIKKGAKLVQRWQDIVEELLPSDTSLFSHREKEVIPEAADLSEQEQAILKGLSCDEQTHIDNLSASTGMNTPELLTCLLSLEMSGAVRQLPGKHFIRTFR